MSMTVNVDVETNKTCGRLNWVNWKEDIERNASGDMGMMFAVRVELIVDGADINNRSEDLLLRRQFCRGH